MAKYKIYIDHDTSLDGQTLSQQMANYYYKGIVALDFQYQGDGPLFIKKANNSSYKNIPMHLGNTKINISRQGFKDRLPLGVQGAIDNVPTNLGESIYSYIGGGGSNLENGSTRWGTFAGN